MLLFLFAILNSSAWANLGQCSANDMNNSNLVEKCENYDGKKPQCEKQSGCSWVNLNEDQTFCMAKNKKDTNYCEDADNNASSCRARSSKCTWYNLGKPKAECLAKKDWKKFPDGEKNSPLCKTKTTKDGCMAKKDICHWKVTVPRPPVQQ